MLPRFLGGWILGPAVVGTGALLLEGGAVREVPEP
jgi:hypothetical protein